MWKKVYALINFLKLSWKNNRDWIQKKASDQIRDYAL